MQSCSNSTGKTNCGRVLNAKGSEKSVTGTICVSQSAIEYASRRESIVESDEKNSRTAKGMADQSAWRKVNKHWGTVRKSRVDR